MDEEIKQTPVKPIHVNKKLSGNVYERFQASIVQAVSGEQAISKHVRVPVLVCKRDFIVYPVGTISTEVLDTDSLLSVKGE